jgi:NAD+ synthase (glutamine-hydrolysing)
MLRIALAQINLTVGDLTGNREKIEQYITLSQKQSADVVVFPELAICGYPPEDLLLKESFITENMAALKSIVKKTKGIMVIIGFVDRDKKGLLYNALAVCADGKIKGVYHKHELPNYGVFDEKRYFHTGKTDGIFTIKGVRVGTNICEDIWIQDSIYKLQAKKKCRVLINLSSSPYEFGKLGLRKKLLIKRAREAKSFIVYVNLVGGQDELVFDGGSLVVDPAGRVIAGGQQFEEELIITDLGSKSKTLPNELNSTEEIYKALVLGTRDYVLKNGFKKVVVGLSGGVDSALVAAIACDAIGAENVIGVTMPSQFTSTGTNTDAKKLAENLNIRLIEIPIKAVHKSYLDALANEFVQTKLDTTEENIQARVRGNLLMALSNKFGWLVLTTGNKSEIAVGYCTLYGDMSGGFAVIKDIPKTKVYELAKFINKEKPGLIPETTITRAPTAELRENQKDQDTLPEYDILDQILEKYIEEHESLDKMSKKFPAELVKRVVRMVDMNEYKRRQAAPGIKITGRAFGKDWRLPLTNKYRKQ